MKMHGISGSPLVMSAHPSRNGTLVMGTDQGLYLSENYGDSFEPIVTDLSVGAAVFSDDDTIIAGTNNEERKIIKINIKDSSISKFNMPQKLEGNITYIAVNLNNNDELSFATDLLSIYTSSDGGENWEVIVEEGKGRKS